MHKQSDQDLETFLSSLTMYVFKMIPNIVDSVHSQKTITVLHVKVTTSAINHNKVCALETDAHATTDSLTDMSEFISHTRAGYFWGRCLAVVPFGLIWDDRNRERGEKSPEEHRVLICTVFFFKNIYFIRSFIHYLHPQDDSKASQI